MPRVTDLETTVNKGKIIEISYTSHIFYHYGIDHTTSLYAIKYLISR